MWLEERGREVYERIGETGNVFEAAVSRGFVLRSTCTKFDRARAALDRSDEAFVREHVCCSPEPTRNEQRWHCVRAGLFHYNIFSKVQSSSKAGRKKKLKHHKNLDDNGFFFLNCKIFRSHRNRDGLMGRSRSLELRKGRATAKSLYEKRSQSRSSTLDESESAMRFGINAQPTRSIDRQRLSKLDYPSRIFIFSKMMR